MDTNVSTPKRSFLRRHPRALRWGAAAAAAAALTLALPINTASGQTTLSAQVTNSILSQLAAIQASINSLATKFDAFVSSFNTFVTSFNTYASGPTSLATSQGSGYAAVNAVRCNINNTASSTATMVLNVYNGSTAVYSSAFTIGSANTLP